MRVSPVVKARNHLGTVSRHGTPEEIKEARRDFAAVKIQEYVKEVVADAPPLSTDQADKIAAMLRPVSRGA